MRKNKIVRIAQLLVLTAPLAAILHGGSAGEDGGYTGAPGESNCQKCHASGNGFGSVKVTFPNGQFYTPGKAQNLTVTVADPSKNQWGFQLTARPASSSTTQAGYFTPFSDGFTQVVCNDSTFATSTKNQQFGPNPCPSKIPLQWIEQTLLGNYPGQQRTASWQFTWLPPASSVGDIVIYVAAVASVNSGNDNVYIAKYTVSVPNANQPAVTGAVDGAGLQTTVSPGAYISVYGSNLSNSTRAIASGDINRGQLPTMLDGVGLNIDGKAAFPTYISPTQINAIVPNGISTASGLVVQAVNNGQLSYPGSINGQSVSPGLFSWNGKYAVATRTDFSLVGPPNLFPAATTVPAKAGDVIILWASGLGTTTPAIAPGILTPATTTANVTRLPTVTIGGIGAQIIGAALAPSYASLYQIAVQIPAGLADGDQVVVVQSNSLNSADGIYLTIKN